MAIQVPPSDTNPAMTPCAVPTVPLPRDTCKPGRQCSGRQEHQHILCACRCSNGLDDDVGEPAAVPHRDDGLETQVVNLRARCDEAEGCRCHVQQRPRKQDEVHTRQPCTGRPSFAPSLPCLLSLPPSRLPFQQKHTLHDRHCCNVQCCCTEAPACAT